ncbi:hypothetical protein VOLCADRAFT_105251 [Volvox carteri f. nagariensis]|uniref:Uncharacterized protein n=1 Tax=Volvox carteri f. nagariensis TaxID=3068 RepID=D8TZL3_VOLCA|nr:uncharacterized protein VOLCADRAFT_105251 [Volvox carteri f. nagariensis]EFJ47034.1 hypothetical protein VOLCADRAFT_105251 [Volvox carteri f. nagariensis]|eukprot:XP_002951929.1 hypothetical protein VOLCADRAFT_105251 [Volvox carteri f. nagariensis]
MRCASLCFTLSPFFVSHRQLGTLNLASLTFQQLLERAETCEASRQAAVSRLTAWPAQVHQTKHEPARNFGSNPRPSPSPGNQPCFANSAPTVQKVVENDNAAELRAASTATADCDGVAVAEAVATAHAEAATAQPVLGRNLAVAGGSNGSGLDPAGSDLDLELRQKQNILKPEEAMAAAQELLRLCAQLGATDDAMEIIAALERRGLKPDSDTFAQLNDVFTYFPPPMK